MCPPEGTLSSYGDKRDDSLSSSSIGTSDHSLESPPVRMVLPVRVPPLRAIILLFGVTAWILRGCVQPLQAQ